MEEAMSLAVASAAADNVMLSGMARALVQHQMLSAEEAADIQKKTDPAKAKFIDVLVSSDGLSALNLARFTADTFGLPLVDLSAFDAGMLLTDLIDAKLLAETLIVPIAKRGNRLTVLLSDPTDLQAIDRIKFRTQATVDPIVVEHDKLRKFIEQLSKSSTGQTKAALDDDPSNFQPEDADEGLALPAALLPGIARALIQNQVISSEQASAIQKKAAAAQGRFIDELISSGQLNAVTLARFASDTFGLPLVDVSAFDAGMLVTDLIDAKLLAETLIVPIAKRGNRLTVLLSDPTDLQAIDRIKFRTQATVDPIVVEHDKLRKFVEQLSQSSTGQTKAAVDDDPSNFQPEEAEDGLALPAAVRPSTARRGTPNSDRSGTTGAAGTAANDTVLPGLARALVQNQVISSEQASAIQKKAAAAQGRFIDELISSGQLNAVTLARFASDTFGLPLTDVSALDAGMLVTDLIDAKLMAETLIVPIAKRGNRLTVLLSDPTDLQAIDRIKFRTQATVDPIVVEHDKLRKFIEQLSKSSTGQTKAALDDDPSNFQPEEADEGLALPAALLPGIARALVHNQLISPEQASAIQKKAAAAQGRFIDELISSGQLRAATLARFASDTFGLPLVDLAAFDAGMLVTDLIDPKLLAETLIVPIAKRGNRLTVLLSDPTDLQAIDRVKFRAQAPVDPIVVEHDKLQKFIEQMSQSLTAQLEPEEEENYFKDLPIGIEDGDIRVFDENTPLRAAK
jgi:type II secretory ATPase GspE/PulE/Tfp pilus assembly ATPase PilB-like protein